MPSMPPVPCPVRLGTVKSGGPPALIHMYTLERNLRKLEKLLKKGVDVDCENNLGQTPLFCASLLGFTNVVELLLQYGADPNHRCADRSTPVHAAVFSCNPWLLSGLLDAGGDLRLHDGQGRTPRDWAEAGAQEHSPRMLDFLKSCVSHMWSLIQTHSPQDGRVTPTSSKSLLRSPSLLELLKPGGSDLLVNMKLSTKSSVSDTVQCFGYGKLCIGRSRQPVGVLASVPMITDSELVQAEDEALYSFTCGSFCSMTNYSWRGCRVTVKELQIQTTQKHAEADIYQDLLITELENCCQLFHPHLLQLMAVSVTPGLLQTRLVYERVHVGSLYTVLYHRRAEFPLLRVCELLAVVLQVCELLLYLHSRALVLRSFSSHSVIIVHPGLAKVTDLGFMVPSEDSFSDNVAPLPLPLPPGLYNWAAPEVIRRRTCTGKADLYSLCTLIQELYTDAVPWGPVDSRWIKEAVDAGQALCADPAVPQPYYQLLQNGLQPQAKDRTCSLQDIRYTLRCDLKELSDRRKSGSLGLSMPRWSRVNWKDREPEKPDLDSVVEREIQDQLLNLDRLLEKETEQKTALTSPRRFQNYDTESCTDTEEINREFSHRDILPLDDWRPSLCPPVVKTGSSVDTWSSISAVEDLATHDTVSEYISSIVLNLKVSQVLLQQAESSLESHESRLMGGQCNQVDAGVSEDEVDGLCRIKKGKVVVLKAVGPPSTYRPLSMLQETEESAGGQQERISNGDEEVSQYCSAGEDSFHNSQGDSREEGKPEQPIRIIEHSDRSYRSSDMFESHQMTTPLSTDHCKPKWTSEVSELVARMARGRLGACAGPVGSSDSEDVEEQQHHLLDRQNSHNDVQLEQLFKSFAGIQSESEESTDFHTIINTFTMQESTEGEEETSSESDCIESPVEPSSIFYTPKHKPDNAETTEELSQTLSSEEDLDVTMEVCRPNMMVTDSHNFRDCQPVSEEPHQSEPESSTSVKEPLQTISQVTDIDDLSSITCSPAQLKEWAGQDGAPPSPHSTRFPPCNSTPRSPDLEHSSAHRGRESVPLLLDTSPWDSVPDPSVGSEHYTTASLGNRNTVNLSQSSFLQTPGLKTLSVEETDTPTSDNQEFTTTKQTQTQNSSQTHSDGSGRVKAMCEEEEEEEDRKSGGSENLDLDQPLHQPGVKEEEDDVLNEEEEACNKQTDEEEKHKPFKKEEENTPETGQNDLPERVLDSDGAAQSSEETERAHSTLDEVLQRLLMEQLENQRSSKEAEAQASEAERACVCDEEEQEEKEEEEQEEKEEEEQEEECVCDEEEKQEECVCPAGDSSVGSVCKGDRNSDGFSSDNVNEQGEKMEAGSHITWTHPHRVIVLEHTPIKTQSEPSQLQSNHSVPKLNISTTSFPKE